MKKMISITFIAAVLLCAVAGNCADVSNRHQALNMAKNWVKLVTRLNGSWGGSAAAKVTGIYEFKRGDRLLGYYCSVEPSGYVVVSLYKELAPVKAYSETDSLDIGSNEGMTDLIKVGLERMIDAVEKRTGRKIEQVSTQEISAVLEINYRHVWDRMAVEPETFDASQPELLANYQAGQILLTSSWHQYWPYNDQCPIMGCSDPANNLRAVVGCVATAGAQLMRYWNWPPWGEGSPYDDTYDWVNMRDRIDGNSSSAEIAAVAELCHEVGQAVGMDYGCDGSAAYTEDMEAVYQDHYRYSTACDKKQRKDYSASEWFDRIKSDLNKNRPIHYRILKHSIVCDGWQEIGVPATKWYHMNYGWDDGHNTWYILDALHYPAGGSTDDEFMLEHIFPASALGSSISGNYTLPTFPYRYVDQDAVCSTSAAFASGHWIQFLPNVTLSCTSTTDVLRLSSSTKLFTRGDASRGLFIHDAAIRMKNGGTIVLR